MLFFAALVVSVVLGVKIHRENQPRCTIVADSGQTQRNSSADDSSEVGFTPCFSNWGITLWAKMLVWSWFILSVAFCSSFSQDCFIYIRGRRSGRIVGPFRLLR